MGCVVVVGGWEEVSEVVGGWEEVSEMVGGWEEVSCYKL